LNQVDPLGLRPTDDDFDVDEPCDDEFTLNGVCVGDRPMPVPDDLEQLYVHTFRLFQGDLDDAYDLVNRIRSRPNDYFPFTVNLVRCAQTCHPPISEGNILSLEASNYAPGHVQVIDVRQSGWTFLALDDHIAAGGTVSFWIVPRHEIGGDSWVELEVIAHGSGRGIEGSAPGWAAGFAGRQTWSQMTAAIICEHLYEGQEEFRRC
jgi:hypothetical protein